MDEDEAHKKERIVAQAKLEEKSGETVKAVAWGKVTIGSVVFDVGNLEDGRRVITQRSMIRGLSGGRESGHLRPYIDRLPNNNGRFTVGQNIEFVMPGGGMANGYDIEWFVDLLKAYDEADDGDLLRENQRHLAKHARVVLRALAGVGFAALVDEATGYQHIRASDGLQRLLDRLLNKEASDWQRFWPAEVVMSLCKTFRIRYDASHFPRALAGVIGVLYQTILGPEVHAEVRRINPDRPDRNKHHQHFRDELRRIAESDMAVVKLLSDQSANKIEFWGRINAHYRGTPLQLLLAS